MIIFSIRSPPSDDFRGYDNLDINIIFLLIIIPDPIIIIILIIDIWDNDQGVSFHEDDDHLGI
jgi:hypothetical protein